MIDTFVFTHELSSFDWQLLTVIHVPQQETQNIQVCAAHIKQIIRMVEPSVNKRKSCFDTLVTGEGHFYCLYLVNNVHSDAVSPQPPLPPLSASLFSWPVLLTQSHVYLVSPNLHARLSFLPSLNVSFSQIIGYSLFCVQ